VAALPEAAPGAGPQGAYCAIVFNDERQVLLVQPRGHRGGYAWTWPQGAASDEGAGDAAVRDVRDAAGVEAVVERRIPGEQVGATPETTCVLLRFVRGGGRPRWETQSVRWATLDEASRLIAFTPNAQGRARDLAALRAASRLLQRPS
jgi:ADP-ribose pyrophosphatase YjhB (NUDIX family)